MDFKVKLDIFKTAFYVSQSMNEIYSRWWEWTYKMNNAGLGISSITSITLTADDRNSSYNVIAFDQAILGANFYVT